MALLEDPLSSTTISLLADDGSDILSKVFTSENHGRRKNFSEPTTGGGEGRGGGGGGGLSRSEATQVTFLLIAVFIPIVSGIGIAGNVMSICVLLRQGFDKSYNVLMAALALADSSFLSAMFAYGFVSAAGFRYPPKVTTFHFVFFEILRVLDYGGGWTSFTLPLLITSERLLAVFFPMSISRLVSPRKTFVSVLAVAGVLYGMMIYLVVLSSLGYDLTSVSNNASSSPGYIELAVFRNSLDSTAAITSFSTVLFGPFPICYVFTGCVVLSLKIKMASRRRSQLTRGHSKQSGSATRVTGTLLVVCLFYTVCSTFVFLLHSDVIRSLYSGADQGLTEVVLQEVVNVVALLNSSVNFLIYIVMNKNFRATFVSILASLFIRGATAAQRHGPR